ncbi:MAG TPA: TolC family protein, partial [Steroidobacteraceae bacterium]|nr:TolC family protein [Steroidobacteraceae bacterium]
MLSTLWRASLACLVLCNAAAAASAAESSAAPPLSLRNAVDAALAGNPDLKEFAFALRAEEARRDGAALRPATELAAELENVLGSGAYQGLSAAETTLAISQVVELGGKREARIAAASARIDTVTSARQAAQLDILAEVARRYVAAAELQEQLRLAERATTLAQSTLEAARLRVQAARAPHVEEDRATVALERSRLEVRSLRSRLEAAKRSLAATWAADDATIDGRAFGDLSGDIYRLPELEAFSILVARIQSNPDFLRFASEERLRESELRLAATQKRSDMRFSGGLRYFGESGDVGLMASFSMPLFAGRRAQSAIAEAAARRDAVGAAREAALTRARAQLFAFYSDLREAQARVVALQSTILPRMEEALQETQYAFDRCRYGYLELVDAQREFLDAQSNRIEAAAQAQLLIAE